MTRFVYYQDPGHGWVEVSLAILIDLGIASQVSHYSYVDDTHTYINDPLVYLEEDCDAGLFIEAFQKKHGSQPDLYSMYQENIFIRKLPRYRVQA